MKCSIKLAILNLLSLMGITGMIHADRPLQERHEIDTERFLSSELETQFHEENDPESPVSESWKENRLGKLNMGGGIAADIKRSRNTSEESCTT